MKLDFLIPDLVANKNGSYTITPHFKVRATKDLMIRGRSFYAVWNEDQGRWSTEQDDALELIDDELKRYKEETKEKLGIDAKVNYTYDSSTKVIDEWRHYTEKSLSDNYHQLDDKLVFKNQEITRDLYASKTLPYALEPGTMNAWNLLVDTLYDKEERHKIEWCIGSIVNGDSIHIQKCMILVGDSGTGKSTILKIIRQMFDGYCTSFSAKALASNNSSFALEPFANNPLVAIEDDADLSRIEDNTRLNSLISHEHMTINEKFKKQYDTQFHSFIMLGTNKEVQITDSRSGLMRRIIDVQPSGRLLDHRTYNKAMKDVMFELGAIAYHCKEVYESDIYAYDDYFPERMVRATNMFYNFIEENADKMMSPDGITLAEAWRLYNEFVVEYKIQYPYNKQKVKIELMGYFKHLNRETHRADGSHVYWLYEGFRKEKIGMKPDPEDDPILKDYDWLKLEETISIFDEQMCNALAQLAVMKKMNSTNWIPGVPWDNCETVLSDIDTHEIHYVKLPENHIVIDFDLKNEEGEKDRALNLAAAQQWPPTYAEWSQSGNGLHLHYLYSGDPRELSRIFADGIEIKVFTGNSSLRRRLSYCNALPIAIISSGLPLKEKKMTSPDVIKDEKHLRALIKKNLNKEIHPGTKPSVYFIAKLLDDAYTSGMHYDVTDMRQTIMKFAGNSTNHANECIKVVANMKFKSEDTSLAVDSVKDELIFYDVEVFPNVFIVCYKRQGDHQTIRMINPTPQDIEDIVQYKLVGYNCRRYDNHILYARLLGYSNEELFNLSWRIVNSDKRSIDKNCYFGEAYNISYTDVYDFCAKKQSLKKWEIELGIHHQENSYPWDQDLPEEHWNEVADYCCNDVAATEAVFTHCHADFLARCALAKIAGLTVNDTTNKLTTAIIFGNEKHPQSTFNYVDLSEMFPGYQFDNGVSTYKGVETGEGGYVYAEKGMYGNVALIDVASMHPSSIIAMDMFGPYTKRFKDIVDARIAIKHKDYEAAGSMLGGALAEFLGTPEEAKDLAYALKIAINSVYGLTAAKFENPFKDPRNIDNIVAKRGALFMVDLKEEVQKRGYTVAHIKTDSIKIPDADSEIIDFCLEFAKKYGYTFEHEATYEKMCLVNDAVYIAKYAEKDICEGLYGYVPGDNYAHGGQWTATGAQFQVSYVYKTLFSHEPIGVEDMTEVFQVSKGDIVMDMNEMLPEDEHNYIFIGKIGAFCPISPGCGGGILYRHTSDDKYYAVTGTKDYRWLDAEMVKALKRENDINVNYYINMVDDAVSVISQYGDFEWFASDDPYIPKESVLYSRKKPTEIDDEIPFDPPYTTTKGE